MAETKLTSEQLEQFIDLYRSFECLWDVKCKDYRDINKRNNAYATIADIMAISVEAVKKKINNIRLIYLQERKKIEASKTTGSGTDDIYSPTLFWYGNMTFLDHVTAPRKTTSTPTAGKNAANANVTNKDSINTTIIEEIPRSTNQIKKKRIRTEEPQDKAFDNAVNALNAICAQDATEFDKFGESVAAQLKQFPLVEAVQIQLEIQQLITQKRLRLLNNQRIYSVLGDTSSRTVTPDHSTPFPEERSVPTPTSIYSYESTNVDNDIIFTAITNANITDLN